MPRRTNLSTLLATLTLCSGCGPVVFVERPTSWQGTRSKTVEVGEAALRAALLEPGIKKVDAPGNEELVMVSQGTEGAPTCLNGAWFTIDGPAKEMLGDDFHYAWKLCAGGKKASLAISCVVIHKTESATDSKDCEGGKIAVAVATRTEQLVTRLTSAPPATPAK